MSPTNSPRLIPSVLAAAVLLLFAVHPAEATDHIVGANRGWNPGINYTLWANNNTFYVGDLISFRYQKNTYNVFEVNRTGYDNCTMDGLSGNWSSGKDFIPLNKSKWYYFICGNGGCTNGMKVSVFVHHLPSPPHPKTTAHSTKSEAGHRGNALVRIVPVLALAGMHLVWV